MATKEFEELALNGNNYLTWASDIKIALASRSLLATIQEPQTGVVLQDKHTYTALALLWFYIHKDLKFEYLMIENPRELWVALKERYEQKKNLFGLRPIMNGIIYISKISNQWQTIIMLFIGFVLS